MAGGFVALEVVAVAHLFQCLALIPAEGFGHIDADVDDDVAIAGTISLDGGQTLAAQPLGGAGLNAGLQIDLE